jgi:DNA polymerase-3 subunit alpha
MTAVSMTDHGNIYGAVNFYQQVVASGLKPIIGCELYITSRSRFERKADDAGEIAYHVVLLAKNNKGYENLVKLTSLGFLDGFYYRPRIDKEILAQYHDGLIGLSACLHGEIASSLMRDNFKNALNKAREYNQILGEGHFYLEMMENGLPEQKIVNEGLMEISRQLSIPLVATNDCHYLNREDADAHEVLLCIQTGKNLDDTNRMRFGTDQLYFRSPEEMRQLFNYCPEAIENTVRIAQQCDISFKFDKFYLPVFELDDGKSLDDHLKAAAEEGFKKRLPFLTNDDQQDLRQTYEDRLAHELKIIRDMGFAGYFLIVSDFVNYAKKRDIPVGPGRGSAAGSLVAFTIGITNIDPIRYNLFFERFLNPDRISMPDIDIDFCQEGRDDIIKYVTEKYGTDKVSQIITFGKMQAKAVIRDVGRAMNISYGEVDRIAKMVPNILNIKLKDAIEKEPRFKEEAKKNDKIRKLIDLSLALEGLNRHSSTHAAGVVISDVPLVERVPLCKSPKGDTVTQYSMNDIQTVGLTKFDFLGLKTLTVIKNTLAFILNSGGEKLDIDNLPLDDRKTYELLMRGGTDGVFQLESAGMKDILVSLKPDCIEDIIAIIALYRPGPMDMIPQFTSRKQGKTEIVYEVPELEAILKETYGVIVYQEQVMQIASMIGNYTMSEADTLRKVMGKKKVSDMEKEKPKFLEGAKIKGIDIEKAKKIWEQMETFAQYGFNKSHSTAYAIITYQTAYLKAHYPVEFMAALLTSEKDNRDKIIKYINVCKEMDISVLPPDINESLRDFNVVGQNIRFGMAAVKNVGIGAIESIIASREKNGKFQSLSDFCSRVDMRKVNKRTIESLIKCGAFDSIGCYRSQLMQCYEEIIEIAHRQHKDKDNGQISLFDMVSKGPKSDTGIREFHMPTIPEWDSKELLTYEKEMLGFYITSHPLAPFIERLRIVSNADSSTIEGKNDKETVIFGGVVSAIREVPTKRKDVMAYLTIEDIKGSFDVFCFSDVYKSAYSLIHSDQPLLIKGVLDRGDETLKVKASEIKSLAESLEQPLSSVHFMVDIQTTSVDMIESLKELLSEHKGAMDGFIHLLDDSAETIIYLGKNIKIDISSRLKQEADSLLGTDATRFV